MAACQSCCREGVEREDEVRLPAHARPCLWLRAAPHPLTLPLGVLVLARARARVWVCVCDSATSRELLVARDLP